MKTVEQMAEEYAEDKSKAYYIGQDGERKWYPSLRGKYTKEDFLAGYAAAQQKWISVKERLPEYNQDVLFYRAKYKDLFVGYRAEQHAYIDPEENGLTDSLIFKYYDFWMPLPELPKENE